MPDRPSTVEGASPAHRLRFWRRGPGPFVPNRALEAAQEFLATEASGGIVLVAAALVALVWVNSPLDREYFSLWHTQIVMDVGLLRIDEDLQHLVNDGLMAFFFFVVGLEIKRELVRGELSDPKRALLPTAAALGGMLVPAAIYAAINAGGEGSRGWGIPMATDIAFAVGVLSLVSRRIPFGVKVFLLSMAIVDDMGSILVIAVFYTEQLSLGPLALALLAFLAVVLLTGAGVRSLIMYMILGSLLWVAMLKSGLPATLTGVALALVTPSHPTYDRSSFSSTVSGLLDHFRMALQSGDQGDQEEILSEIEDLAQGSEAPLERFERTLHPWVSYLIMPVFALANAGMVLNPDTISDAASSPVTHGIIAGHVAGKVLGISLFAWLAVRLGWCALPTATSWAHIIGVAMLGGIGFAVSLFVTGLAFDDARLVADAKMGILVGSVIAGSAGFLWLRSLPEVEQEPRPIRRPRVRASSRRAT
jgi:NhaA family Na+:H+ antiporter